MKFYNLCPRLEVLCNNVGLNLVNQYDSIADFLRGYPATERDEELFNYILDNPPSRQMQQPLRVWESYTEFKKNLEAAHNHYPREKMPEHINPILIEIVLGENKLLLLKCYSDQIVKPSQGISELEIEGRLRRWMLVLEHNAVNIIEDNTTKASLYKVYLRNSELLGSKSRIYLQREVSAVCNYIICSINANLLPSENEVEKQLTHLRKVIRIANQKKVGVSKQSVFALYKKLGESGYSYAQKAFSLFKSIRYEYVKGLNNKI